MARLSEHRCLLLDSQLSANERLAGHLYNMVDVTELTEGMKVVFEEGGPVLLCVGRDKENFLLSG